MPFGLPVTVLSFVSVVEVHSDRDRLALKLCRNLNFFDYALPDMLI